MVAAMTRWIALSYLCLGLCLDLCLALPAAAQAPQAGNLPADFYPRPNCVKPDINKVNRMDRDETIRYNRQIKAYNACAKAYLVNANNDADYVLALMNAQVAIANGEAVPPITPGPSNMPADFYPRSACLKPDKAAIGETPSTQRVPTVAATGKPATADGVQAMDAMAAYNQRVTLYNMEMTAFNACSKDYIAKGRIDIAHIQAATQAAQ